MAYTPFFWDGDKKEFATEEDRKVSEYFTYGRTF